MVMNRFSQAIHVILKQCQNVSLKMKRKKFKKKVAPALTRSLSCHVYVRNKILFIQTQFSFCFIHLRVNFFFILKLFSCKLFSSLSNMMRVFPWHILSYYISPMTGWRKIISETIMARKTIQKKHLSRTFATCFQSSS